MITRSCIELLVSADEAGMLTDESRLNTQFLIGVLDACRERYIQEMYGNQKRVIPQSYIQVYEARLDTLMQEDPCWSTFPMPDILHISDERDGLMFVGPRSGSSSYHRVNGKAGEALENAFDNDTGLTMCVLEQPLNIIRVKTGTQKLNRLYTEIVARHPTKVGSFNIDKDDYPIDGAGMTWVESFVRTGMVRQILITRANANSDGENAHK